MTITDALAALDRADTTALEQFTREDVHLPKSATHFVTVVLFEKRKRFRRMSAADNPIAYVRDVAQRLMRKDEQLVQGAHVVRDTDGKRIGVAYVNSCYRADGSMNEFADGAELGAIPDSAVGFRPDAGINLTDVLCTDREKRIAYWHTQPTVKLTDDDERAVDRAQRHGYSRREMADILRISAERIESAWKRLYRRRRGQLSPAPTCMHGEG